MRLIFQNFRRASLERDFKKYFRNLILPNHRIGIYLSVLVWIIASFGINYGYGDKIMEIVKAEIVLLIPFSLTIVTSYSKRWKSATMWFAALSNVSVGLMLFHVSLHVIGNPHMMVTGLMVVFLFASFILRISFSISVFTSLLLAAVAQALLLFWVKDVGNDMPILSLGIWLTWLTCSFGAFFLEQSSRNVFIANRELEQLNEQLRMETFIDPLTRLYNRQYFFEALKTEMYSATRLDEDLCLVMIDIDHFKKINDQLGHTVGDKALVSFSTLLKESFRESDVIARYGGEEFIMFMKSSSLSYSLGALERFMEKLRNVSFESVSWPVTCSIGIVKYKGESDPLELVEKADKLLYSSKKNGRNRVSS